MEGKSIFGERLTSARMAAGYTQYTMAEKLGMPRNTLSGYENDGKEAKYATLCRIADLLDVSADYLIGRTNTRHPERDPGTIKRLSKLNRALDVMSTKDFARTEEMLNDIYAILEVAIEARSDVERDAYAAIVASTRKMVEMQKQRTE